MQPYKRGRGGRNNGLALLAEVNNADKHRLLQVVAARWGGGPAFGGYLEGKEATIPYIRSRTVLKDGAKLFEAPPRMHVDSKILPLVVFSEGSDVVKNRRVSGVIDDLIRAVDEVINTFTAEFPALIQ